MKKTLILGTMLAISTGVWAQKSKMRDARDYLSDNNYKKALPVINEAVNNDETKGNAEAWYLRGMAYLQQATDKTATATGASTEAYTSFQKALSLKPDYDNTINSPLYNVAILSFNDGVEAYKKNDHSAAYDQFMKVVSIYGNGKRFTNDKIFAAQYLQSFAELVTNAKANAAYAALNAKRDNDALSLFNELRTAPGPKDSNIYLSIIDIYARQKNDAQLLAAITEGRTLFPTNNTIRNQELNYYIMSGKQDVLLGKLEDAVKGDPNNAELLFNLGNSYERAAFPKDAAGKDLPRPANFADLFAKAESAYARAIAANPSNPDYQYNAGIIYYNNAADFTKKMNAITGMSAPEKKQYDALLAERNGNFTKALPYFERAYGILDAKYTPDMSVPEKVTYQNSMIALREIYSRQDNKTKFEEIKKKLDALK